MGGMARLFVVDLQLDAVDDVSGFDQNVETQ